MTTHFLWLWITAGWFVASLTEARTPGITPICELGPCSCDRGNLQCDCSRSIIKEIVLSDDELNNYLFSTINIANCRNLVVKSEALSGLPALHTVNIANTATLSLQQRAFHWTTDNEKHTGLVINITNCTIPEIPSYCFRGDIRDILLTSVNVSHVRSFAFTSIGRADKFQFNKVVIKDFEPQSFKSFNVWFLTFMDSHFQSFPERVMINVGVNEETRFENLTIGRIESSAIEMLAPRSFKLVRSKIGHIESYAFKVILRGDVSIHENVFSYVEDKAFLGFTVEPKYLQESGKEDLIFENNSLDTVENGSLAFNTTGFEPMLDWVMINQSCSCADADRWINGLVSVPSGSKSVNYLSNLNAKLYCKNPKPVSLKDYQRVYCFITKSSLLMKLLVIAVVIIVLTVICLIVYFALRKKAKRYINVPTSKSELKPAELNKAHMLVVPEGKTYRETELHVIVEHVDPIIPKHLVRGRPDKEDTRPG